MSSIAWVGRIDDHPAMVARPFQTETRSFADLLGNGRAYAVPRFQRDYAWDTDEWKDLWEDLIANLDGKHPDEGMHYMGYVVTQAPDPRDGLDPKTEWLIDGQQRLTTLSIVLLAGMRLLSLWADEGKGETPEANREREAELRRRFIGHRDPAALTTTPKLALNRLDDEFWRFHVLRARAPAKGQRLYPSNRRMWRAFEFYERHLSETFIGDGRGFALTRFLADRVGDQLVFTVITVDNDLAAYKVFETLNARGVKLSTSDLLKNHLLLVVARGAPSDLELAERLWTEAAKALGSGEFPTYLRHFWNAGHRPVRAAGLFREVRAETKDATAALELLQALFDQAPLYRGLDTPAAPLWTREQRPYVEALSYLGASQFAPLVIAAGRRSVEADGMTAILRICLVVTLRHHVSGLNPSALEEAWSNAAQAVLRDGFLGTKRLMPHLRPVYRDDQAFEHDFSLYARDVSRHRVLLRWMLCALEGATGAPRPDHDEPGLTVEHILPRNADPAEYPAFDEEVRDEYVHRLGNLALLIGSGNRDAGSRPFAEKRPILETSQYQSTRALAAFEDWTPAAIHRRQLAMARHARQIWRLDT